jgi:hypothetical protein
VISVIVPTIAGRELWLEQCRVAYAAHTDDYELIVVPNRPTCGLAWQDGADLAEGEFLHFTADDIEPHVGWWQAAVACVETGAIPSPRILNTDGSLQSSGEWGVDLADGTVTAIARIPFMSREQWDTLGPSLPIHYYTDNWIAYRAAQAGIPTVVCRGYEFTHHFAPEGRLDGADGRMYADYLAYQRAIA